ncbi:MAG: helicase HerA domain-containing protein [Candidatus Aenigmatarchaeota archaeon]
MIIDKIILSSPFIYRNDSFVPNKANITVHVRDSNIGDAQNANVSFFNSSSYLGSCLTNSSGYCTFVNFDVDDNIQPQLITIYINATSNINEPSETNTTTIIAKGILFANITKPDITKPENAYWPKYTSISVSAQVWSENGENSTQLNPTVEWWNETATLTIGIDTYIPQTIVAEQLTGKHSLMAKAKKSYYDDGISNVTIYINSLADVIWIYPSQDSIMPYPEQFNATCMVKDTYAGGIADYNVSMYYKLEPSSEFILLANLKTNSSGYASYSFKPLEKGNYTFKCNITDDPSKYYSANTKEATSTFWIKDIYAPLIENIEVNPVYGLEANLNSTNITARIIDNYDIDSVWINVTLPNSSFEIVYMQNITPKVKVGDYVNATYSTLYTPKIDGIHSIYIYARDALPESNVNYTFASNVSVYGKVYGKIDLKPSSIVALNITQATGFSFDVFVNFTNLGPANMYSVNLTHSEFPANSLIYNETMKSCGNLKVNETCYWNFKITVPPKTPPSLIKSFVIATWLNPERSLNSTNYTIGIEVASNPMVIIDKPYIEKIAPHDKTTFVDTITVISYGNDEIRDVKLLKVGGNLQTQCPECILTIYPEEFGYMPAGTNYSASLTIYVPKGQPPGNYFTTIRANTTNAGYYDSLLNITVPVNASWIVYPTDLGKVFIPPETSGTLAIINITNIGNVKLSFEILPSGNASKMIKVYPETAPQVSSFELEKLASRSLIVNYSTFGIQEGVYSVEIILKNLTYADPASRTIPLIINVTDLPPEINNVIIPEEFEVGYENVTIYANITDFDNTKVDKAWINVTLPNSTSFVQLMKNISLTNYTASFFSNLTGLHIVDICANDTKGLLSCLSFNVTGTKTTKIDAQAEDLIADNVTIVSDQTIYSNITVKNVGGARAFNVTINSSSSPEISINPKSFYYPLIYKKTSISNTTNITVLNSTLPGTYFINLNISWINLDGSLNSTNKTIKVNVTENPFVAPKEDKLEFSIESGKFDSKNFTILSIGNVNATNISFSCFEGKVCSDFSISFIPSSIPFLARGENASILINVSVPFNYQAGTYNGSIKIAWNSTKYSILPITVKVPINISWNQKPENLEKDLMDETSGLLAILNLTNTGNYEVPLNLSIEGNISSVLSLNETNITIPYAGYKEVKVFYNLSRLEENKLYTGKIIARISPELENVSLIIQTETNITIRAHSYHVKIVYPTQENPIKGVKAKDTIKVKVNLTYNGIPVSIGAAFNVSIFNSTFVAYPNITSYYNDTEKLTNILVTMPNISEARIYSLNVSSALTTGGITLEKFDKEEESIIYADSLPPRINIGLPVRIPVNQSVSIYINVTEEGGLKNVSVKMIKPDNSTELINLTFVKREFDVYYYTFNYSNTSLIGNYSIQAFACDKSENCGSLNVTFTVYPIAWIAGEMRDYENINRPPINAKLILFDETGEERFNLSLYGTYNHTIDSKSYNLMLKVENGSFNPTIFIENVKLDRNLYNPIIVGSIPKERTTTSALKTLYIDSILNFTNATITFSFADCANNKCGLPIYDPTHLGIYVYQGNWTPSVSTAINTNWKRISNLDRTNSDNSINLTTLTASVRVTHFSAYILAEFICGNQECESAYGESTSNCPIDCPYIPPPSAVGGAGGAGFGGIGAGGAGAAPPTFIPNITLPNISVPNITLPNITLPNITRAPVEFKETVIDITVAPMEEKVFSVDVTNHLEQDMDVIISVQGPAAAIVNVQTPTIKVPAKSIETASFRVFASSSVAPGIYIGEIVLTSGKITHKIPLTIKVVPIAEPLLDVKTKVLTKTVAPGKELMFEVTLINMGQTPSVEDITVTYTVRTLNEPYKIIATSQETLAVVNTLTFTRKITIPENTPQDSYLLVVNASYWYGKKYAMSADSFEVSELPAPVLMLKAVFSNWVTYLILMIVLPIGYVAMRWYAAYRAAKLAKRRYVAPIDFKELPQPGPNSIEVGKIAETDVKAYLDVSQLIMHTIAAGGSGSGKTISAMVVAEELLKRKVPVIVFDPTAQWTGFIKPCRVKQLLDYYPKFGLKPTDARSFKTNIVVVEDPNMEIDIKKYMQPGEITVFVMNRLKPEQLDAFVRRSVQAIFDMRPPESKEIKLLLVYDEVHRLLPKYGGKGGYVAIERAVREFRKWGIGVFLVSQVLLDFKAAVRANIANEIQLRTRYEGDIGRVKSKYGQEYATKVTKLTIGTGLFQNPEYNHGKPWFISFRPILHSPFALTDDEINQYVNLNKKIEEIEAKIAELKKKGIDTYDMEIELNIAKDKLKTGAFRMVETYLESLQKRIEKVKK